MRHSMVLLAVVLSMTGCKVMHHSKAAMHGPPPDATGNDRHRLTTFRQP